MTSIIPGYCCCTATHGCQPCPSPIPPATTREWEVSVVVDGIIGDSDGSGAVFPLDYGQPSCARGSCGRQTYIRKAVDIQDFSGPPICPYSIPCDAIVNEPAPTAAGDHTIRWSFCGNVFPACDFGGCPDIFNDQGGNAYIDSVMTGLKWNFGTCLYEGATSTDCATVIVVRFWYDDTFSYPMFYELDGECRSDLVTASIYKQEWVCYYVRQVGAGQYFSEGDYSLLRCEYPSPQTTVKTDGSWTLCIGNGTVCSSSYGVSVAPPTTWQPPRTIKLTRNH